MDKITEQFNRVKRWHKKFEEISKGKAHNQESNYYKDVMYAFFQNCFHLKDWVINSSILDKKIINQTTICLNIFNRHICKRTRDNDQ